MRVEARRVAVRFPAVNEERLYSVPVSQLRRVALRKNDRLRLRDGRELVVEKVMELDGLLMYGTADRVVREGELADTIGVSGPGDRLLAGQTDDLQTHALRAEALEHWSAMLGSPVRGYSGGRIDLIPHQLSIAVEVCSRLVPRVLLADEVGLGKTIEAGLILHRLHLTGRADRILILVPEPLLHQWFVEMLRRFNLPFSIFDEERCEAIEEHNPGVNPFLESQLVLCGIDHLARNRGRAAQALEAGWNMLVVDEAHHLEWTPRKAGTAYKLVEALAATIPGVLMLTGTPQQLGPEGHFARLRLLDPDRYVDLNTFLEETAGYEKVAQAVEHILEGRTLTGDEYGLFAGSSERIRQRADALAAGVDGAGERLIADLLDSFGTGRVMFRNTRAALSGFPDRKAWLAPIAPPAAGSDRDATRLKIAWLADLLRDLEGAKVLLICESRRLAEEIHKRLPLETSAKAALFHEGLTLVQRDRNAAYFAESDGARILICSEIGSEGRNFQFAHHLVLFDLPADPDLLEQRIGRLDRIGQKETVNIHVPYLPATESEVLARWYHEGLNAFEENLHGAAEIAHVLESDLRALMAKFDEEAMTALIDRSRAERRRITGKLAHGYDRLLALNSNKPERAAETARWIREADADRTFERFFVRLLDHFGVYVEELDYRTYLFRPDYLLTDEFPALPEDGMWATFDRARALSREDINFMTGDHPFLLSVMELLLKGESGNASFAVWEAPGEEALLLEALLVVECIAPAGMQIDRFLHPRPVRVVVDHHLNDRTDDPRLAAAQLRNGDVRTLLQREGVTSDLLPAMLDAALDLAAERTEAIVAEATSAMTARLRIEIERLEDLHQINSHVTLEEIAAARAEESGLRAALGTARARVAALRLIWRGPKGK